MHNSLLKKILNNILETVQNVFLFIRDVILSLNFSTVSIIFRLKIQPDTGLFIKSVGKFFGKSWRNSLVAINYSADMFFCNARSCSQFAS